jgi:hypothetical protein
MFYVTLFRDLIDEPIDIFENKLRLKSECLGAKRMRKTLSDLSMFDRVAFGNDAHRLWT